MSYTKEAFEGLMSENIDLKLVNKELVEALEAMMKALRNIRDENYDNWLKVVDAPTMNAWTQCTQALTKAKGGQG